ncbi:hypothetical protein GCM10027176_08570 [Actinoallomurus bryophytorum]|uniref:LPXTG-motif cell wall-anchored protein n=1 Tax=Actinoallomurus bryophytorum TaxID=1490222 RepID=A0A543CTN9_9ACTN|nr:LPXTG cell wall anchor domain-containing protein [Actinoallomurus bryophytorum]TQM00476.1 LPXTG-motif cell wall-anchored protein [Actinoallomurus bryophytorum]
MPETAFAAAGRVLFLLIAVVAMMTASLRPGTALAAQAPQNRCDVPGKVYTQTIIVDRKNGPIGTTTLFLVCRPSHVVAIVDSDGGTYKDLADFQAHNHLFGAGDTITLPRDFPAVDPGKRDLVTVSGHTGSSSVWWWMIGGVVLILAAGGGLLVLRARRRRSPAADPETDADAQEP